MAFNHQEYNTRYVLNAREGGQPLNDAAEQYGVRIVEAAVDEGETYWQVIGVHHLLPRENFSKHHVYLEALDENGNRLKNPHAWAGWTWKGRRSNERADPIPLDKPTYETAGNIAMHFGQFVSVWLLGLSRDGQAKSDRVENLHTQHPDEPLPDGRLLNTLGHHSFYVVFQRTQKESGIEGEITGQVERGAGYLVQLLRGGRVIASQQLDDQPTFRFANLPLATYQLKIVDTEIEYNNIKLDTTNPSVHLNLALPPPTDSVIFGRIQNGQGRLLLLIKEGIIITRYPIPESGEYRFANLAEGVYALQLFDTSLRQENIVLDGTNSREINLTVPDPGEEETLKTIQHYLLLGPAGSRGRQTNLILALDFILAFSVTVGFSLAEARQARYVTILGQGISRDEQEAIRQSGSQVELLTGNPYAIEAELADRVHTGQPFPQDQG